jgi:Fe-S-cluster containining protein
MSIKNDFPHTWANMQRMQRKIPVKLEREQYDLAKQVRKIIGRSSTLAALDAVYEYVDRYFDAAKNLVACKRGCANCCHGRVWISQAEADFIASKISRTAPQIESIEDEDSFPIRDNKFPCTFLGDDLSCSIYENRPLVCRTHFNFEQTNALCEFENADRSIPLVDKEKTIPGVMKAMAEILDSHDGGGADIRRYFGPGKLRPTVR